MFATRRRSFGSPTRAEALVLGQNCASLVTKITIFCFVWGGVAGAGSLLLLWHLCPRLSFSICCIRHNDDFLEFQIFYWGWEFQIFNPFFGIANFLLIFWNSNFFTYILEIQIFYLCMFWNSKNFFLDFVTDRQTDRHNKGRGILVV